MQPCSEDAQADGSIMYPQYQPVANAHREDATLQSVPDCRVPNDGARNTRLPAAPPFADPNTICIPEGTEGYSIISTSALLLRGCVDKRVYIVRTNNLCFGILLHGTANNTTS